MSYIKMTKFKNREEAGRRLAEKLAQYKGTDAVVYALPRGGVVLGRVIADALYAPLDLVVTRKIGHPYEPEYAVCAVAEDGCMICNEEEKKSLEKGWFDTQVEKEKAEAKRRREVYHGGKPLVSATGKIAIVVDDGVATGLTIRLAIKELRHQNPKKLIVAVPVLPTDTAEIIKKEADELVAVDIDANYLGAVGAYYEDFPQLEDEEVIKLMK